MKSPLEQFDIINIKLISLLGVDLSFNNILVPFCLVLLFFLFVVVFIYYNKLSIIPYYIQNILENIYAFLVSLVKQQTGSYGLF
jgi:F0F1-type ATP synthase membrane subunit a